MTLQITGGAGGEWTVQSKGDAWRLYAEAPEHPLRGSGWIRASRGAYTKGVTSSESERHARIEGDDHLGKVALRMVSVMG